MAKKQKDSNGKVSEEQIKELSNQLDEAQSLQMRALADLQNYQRREGENKKNWGKFAIAGFLTELIPRVVELQLSREHTEDKDVEKTIENFLKSLEKAGLQEIKSKKGAKIDPEIHEVVMAEEGKVGTVVKSFESGWQFYDMIIKPEKVSSPTT